MLLALYTSSLLRLRKKRRRTSFINSASAVSASGVSVSFGAEVGSLAGEVFGFEAGLVVGSVAG